MPVKRTLSGVQKRRSLSFGDPYFCSLTTYKMEVRQKDPIGSVDALPFRRSRFAKPPILRGVVEHPNLVRGLHNKMEDRQVDPLGSVQAPRPHPPSGDKN